MANLADVVGTAFGIALAKANLPVVPTFCALSLGYLMASRCGAGAGGVRVGRVRGAVCAWEGEELGASLKLAAVLRAACHLAPARRPTPHRRPPPLLPHHRPHSQAGGRLSGTSLPEPRPPVLRRPRLLQHRCGGGAGLVGAVWHW